MQSVEHLCNVLNDFNWQHACTVPLHQQSFLFRTGLRLALAMCAGLAHSVGRSWCGVINYPSSVDHFRRRYQTAPYETFAATWPCSHITLGRLILSCGAIAMFVFIYGSLISTWLKLTYRNIPYVGIQRIIRVSPDGHQSSPKSQQRTGKAREIDQDEWLRIIELW